MTASSISDLNTSAAELRQDIETHRYALVHDAMDKIGRWVYSDAKNVRTVYRWLNWLALVVHEHVDLVTMLNEWREHISALPPTAPKDVLKQESIKSLIAFQSWLSQVDDCMVVFCASDIKISSRPVTLDAAEIWPGQSLLSSSSLDSFPMIKRWVSFRHEQYPHGSFVVVRLAGHPVPNAALARAADEKIAPVLGFLATQDKHFAPPPRYPFVGGARGTVSRVQVENSSSTPLSSVMLLRESDAPNLEHNFRTFVNPTLTCGRAAIESRARRVLDAARRAAFLHGCGENTDALGCLWRGIEAAVGGMEKRDRGSAIARRVAALLVDISGCRSDSTIELTDEDVRQFACAVVAGEGPQVSPEVLELLEPIASSADSADYWLARYFLARQDTDTLLEWKLQQITSRSGPGGIKREQVVSAIAGIRQDIERYYRLRNDLVHDAYSHDEAASSAYDELRDIFGATMLNILYNLSRHASHDEFLDAVDGHYALLVEPREVTIRRRAFQLWQERGAPLGDPLTDWLAAERETIPSDCDG